MLWLKSVFICHLSILCIAGLLVLACSPQVRLHRAVGHTARHLQTKWVVVDVRHEVLQRKRCVASRDMNTGIC